MVRARIVSSYGWAFSLFGTKLGEFKLSNLFSCVVNWLKKGQGFRQTGSCWIGCASENNQDRRVHFTSASQSGAESANQAEEETNAAAEKTNPADEEARLNAINARGFRLIQKAASPNQRFTAEEMNECQNEANEFERKLKININRRPCPKVSSEEAVIAEGAGERDDRRSALAKKRRWRWRWRC